MKSEELINAINKIGKDSFTNDDLRQLFPFETGMRTSIKRLIDRGIVVVVTHGVYCLKDSTIDVEKKATQIYVPSYVSFESALSKYGVINQGFNKITLATTRHTKKVELLGVLCEYIQLKSELFFGFNLVKDIYLAEPEKALLDEIYLVSLGKRKINMSEWNFDGLNKKKIGGYLKFFPPTVGKIIKEML